MIKPYDFGKNNLVEQCQKIRIDDIIREINKEAKKQMIQAYIESLDIELKLITSHTRFNGVRYWFSCPICRKRVGVIYQHPFNTLVGCRSCLSLRYKKRRFKGMLEGESK